IIYVLFILLNDPAPTEIYTLSLHDALPISSDVIAGLKLQVQVRYHILTDKAYKTLKTRYGLQGDHPYSFAIYEREVPLSGPLSRSEEHTSELQSRFDLVCRLLLEKKKEEYI